MAYACHITITCNPHKLKRAVSLLILTLANSVWSQIVEVDCNNVGKPLWPTYQQYREDLANGKMFARIREYDANIWNIDERHSTANHIFDDVYIRWLLTDTSIPYIIRITDIMDHELIRMKLSQCAAKLYPDSIMVRYKKEFLIVHIEREETGGFNEGIAYLFKPVDKELRSEIASKLDTCEDMNCQIDLLIRRKLYFDALTLIEAANEQSHPDKEDLRKKYWDIVSMMNE